jgi:two-component system, NarL family, nitrate/nitrite response regulator NarL
MTEQSNPIGIVIGDKQQVVRQGLSRLLESDPDFRILGQASDAYETAELVHQTKPGVLLIDLDLSRELELETLSSLASSPPIRILATVGTVQRADIVDAFLLGAHGIVLKASLPGVLIQSIHSVMAGQYWLENASLGILVKVLREVLSHDNGVNASKDYGLTRRELDIIAKIVSGRSNKEVGADFSISERTVKHHLTNIFYKVGVTSRLQLALFAVTHRLNKPATSFVLRPMQSDKNA